MTSPKRTRQRRQGPHGRPGAAHWRTRSHNSAGAGPRWWLNVVLALLILHPYLLVGMVDLPGQAASTFAGHVATVVADLVLLGAALVFSFDARLTRDPARWRCAVIAALAAVQDLPLVVLALGDVSMSGYGYRLTFGHLATVGLILAILAFDRRRTVAPEPNPLIVGILIGATVLAVRVTLAAVLPSPFLDASQGVDHAIGLMIGLGLAASAVLLWQSSLPTWAARRLAFAMAVIFAGRLWSMLLDATTPPPVAVAAVALCSATIAVTAASLLRRTLSATAHRLETLLERATGAEESVRHGREVAHEVRATTAGIVAGARLLSSRSLPDGPQRSAIAAMLDAEASRLGRVLEDHTSHVAEVDLDELVRLLVIAHTALGHPVTWEPSGHIAVGQSDAVAEAVNVLLHNVRRHASGLGTRITFARSGDTVEIRVSDRGPGVDPDVLEHLFEWGVHRPGSPGEGIGLQRAQRLLREQGGGLHLEQPTPAEQLDRTSVSRGGGRGATFVVTLPWLRSDRPSVSPDDLVDRVVAPLAAPQPTDQPDRRDVDPLRSAQPTGLAG